MFSTAGKIKLLVLGMIIVAFLSWLMRAENEFVSEIIGLGESDVESISMCDVVSRVCRVIDNRAGAQLSAAIEAMSQAQVALPPSKASIAGEALMQVKLRTSTGEKLHRCYRVVEYTGFDEIYLNQVTTDPECTRIEKYRSGYAAISRASVALRPGAAIN